MKKLYSTLLLALTGSFLWAQSAAPQLAESDQVNTAKQHSDVRYEKSGGNVVWSEDFGNGFPSGWIIDDQSGICPWKWSMNGSHGYFNGNQATTYDNPINSTTGNNGFLICDPDSANHFTYGQPSSSNYQYLDTYFITDAINLSGVPAVKLEFEQYFRFNNSVDLLVSVSNDGGNTWTDWTVQGTAINNAASANPETVSINISGVAGNEPDVRIKIGWSARVYYWMIDDMQLVEAPADDISIDGTWFDPYIEYYQYPVNQTQPLTFQAYAINEGANAQSNVQLEVEVQNSQQTPVFNGSSAPIAFPVLHEDTLTTTTSYTPGAIDNYNIFYTIGQSATDLVPGNDSVVESFAVTDTVYARDNNDYASQWYNDEDGNGLTYSFAYGNMFEFPNNDVATSISFYLGTNTDPNTLVFGVLYDRNGFTYIDQTVDYDVLANDIGGWITIPFSSPVPLTAGIDYVACAGHYGGPDEVWVGRASNSSPEQTAFLLDGFDNTWYYTTRSPMVRLNLQSLTTNIDEQANTITTVNAYPNPAKDLVRIDYHINATTNVTLELYDVTGKLLQSNALGERVIGTHSAQLDLQGLSAGAYTYRLITNHQSVSRRLMVTQ